MALMNIAWIAAFNDIYAGSTTELKGYRKSRALQYAVSTGRKYNDSKAV